jgi:hypothetical protein
VAIFGDFFNGILPLSCRFVVSFDSHPAFFKKYTGEISPKREIKNKTNSKKK